MTFKCPVCFFDGLKKPPIEHMICQCCGTQFGYHDETPEPKEVAHARLRANWIAKDGPWHSRVIPPPPYWNPWGQIIAAKFGSLLPYTRNVEVTEAVNQVNAGLGVKPQREYKGLEFSTELMAA